MECSFLQDNLATIMQTGSSLPSPCLQQEFVSLVFADWEQSTAGNVFRSCFTKDSLDKCKSFTFSLSKEQGKGLDAPTP
jgi:hypothetical protein